MKTTLVKEGRKIIGFVKQRAKTGQFYFAFGKPSQSEYIAFDCKSEQAGIEAFHSGSRYF